MTAAAPPGIWNAFTPMARYDSEPRLVIDRAEGNRLIDRDGREYIDGVASIWAIVHGHGHPHIVEAIRRQAERLQHSTLLGAAHSPALELTERLAAHVPGGLTRFFYSSDGASAVEAALKMALQYRVNTGRPERRRFAVMEMAYHGDTLGAASLGGEGPFRRPYESAMFEPLRFANPRPRGCGLCSPESGCSLACLGSLERLLDQHAGEIAAVVVEPRVQGAAGIVVAPEGHLRRIADLCRSPRRAAHRRRGGHRLRQDRRHVRLRPRGGQPRHHGAGQGDQRRLPAPLGDGGERRVYDAFHDPDDYAKTLYHGHTYGGNPIACAAALASLDIFEREPVLARVGDRAAFLGERLREVLGEHPLVGEIRQQGLMAAVDLVADRASRRPLPASEQTGWRACMKARDRGVFVRPIGDTVVVMPPLSIEEGELSRICEAVRYGLDSVARSTPALG